MQATTTAAPEVRIGAVGDFPVGEFKRVEVRKRPVAVLRGRDGGFEAFLDSCPHRGAPICRGKLGGTLMPSKPGELVYGMDAAVIRCPWHGYEFDIRSGECLFTGTDLKLRKFAVSVRDQDVFLRLT